MCGGRGCLHPRPWRPRHDVPDGGAGQLLDPVREPCVKPLGDVCRQRRDDYLVVALGIPRLGDRDHRIRVADAPIDLEPVLAQMLGPPAARSFSAPTSSLDVAVTLATTSTVRFQVIRYSACVVPIGVWPRISPSGCTS